MWDDREYRKLERRLRRRVHPAIIAASTVVIMALIGIYACP